jgi:hypothetical protein
MHRFCFYSFVCCAIANIQVAGQELVNPYWDMQTPVATYASTSSCSFSVLSPGNNYGNTVFLSEASASTGYNGASGGWNASLAARTGSLQKESLGSAFIEFSIIPAQGFRYILKSISFGLRSTPTGPQQWALFQEEDQYTLSLAQGQIANNSTWSLVEVNGINFSAAKKVIFRIYGFDGVGIPAINVANWRLDDLMLQLQVVPDNLPVTWLYQRVKTIPGQVVVEWATAHEVEVESFIIQRSADAVRFDNIAQISPQSLHGFSTTQHFYRYVDSMPLPDQSFYRILQRDISGATELSTIFIVKQPGVAPIYKRGQLLYVPSAGILKLPFNYEGPVELQLITMNGQLISKDRLNAAGGVLKFIPPQWARGYSIMLLAIPMGISDKQHLSTRILIN